jgi:4-hydroxy-3-polyprenylbenzoate decarboxylase
MPRDDHSEGNIDVSRNDGRRPHRVIVGITAVECLGCALRLLEVLRELGIETHVVMSDEARFASDAAAIGAVESLAAHFYQPSNQAARISSGSFLVDGMIVAPCSPSAAGAIAYGVGRDLIHRAADVTIKEGRPLVLLVVEDTLSPIARDNLARLEAINGVSVVRPAAGACASDGREGTIDFLLHGAGIERE